MRYAGLSSLCCALLAACGPSFEDGRPRLTVAAAASLRELLEETAPDFEAESGAILRFAFAASSTLARQIEAGADFDLLLSADAQVLARAGPRVRSADAEPFLGNRLALLTHAERALRHPCELLETDGAIAVPAASVPAGRYARLYLERQGLLEALVPRIAQTDHVRAALALVESGACEHAFVYATDARLARRTRTAWTQARGEEPRIEYVCVGVGALGASASAGAGGASMGSAASRVARDGERLSESYRGFLAGASFARVAERLGFESLAREGDDD